MEKKREKIKKYLGRLLVLIGAIITFYNAFCIIFLCYFWHKGILPSLVNSITVLSGFAFLVIGALLIKKHIGKKPLIIIIFIIEIYLILSFFYFIYWEFFWEWLSKMKVCRPPLCEVKMGPETLFEKGICPFGIWFGIDRDR